MKRRLAALALLGLLAALAACGAAEEPSQEEPLALGALGLECAAPASGGGDFPGAARAFGEALLMEMEARGLAAESLGVTFSRADGATAQALAEEGVQLAVLSSLACGAETLPLLALTGASGAETGLVCAAASDYGRQLAARAGGASPVTWEEWDRAVWGAAEDAAFLRLAASQWLLESCGHEGAELASWKLYESEAALCAAAEAGEVDVLLLAGESELPPGGAVLGETLPLYERVLAVSPETAEKLGEDGREALCQAAAAAAETAAGRAFLEQYGCGGFTAVTEEERAALVRLAEREDIV